ncbi:MAG: hypothetical protein ACI89X_000818 [Planctomycetota bacterium]|jgi:hypothetical protein
MISAVKENQLLWQRLAAFKLDQADAALPFSRRLARENGWQHLEALAAIEEYRRFVFLATVAGHPVTPSGEVDQVWHLHLCYTRSYWDELCGEVLGRPLHHGPTQGGAEEGRKYADWYSKTVDSYEQHFGEKPPQRWWPAPNERFARRDWRRVDVAGTLLVSRRSVKRQVIGAATVLGLFTAASCRSLIGDNVGALIAILAVFAIAGLVWHLKQSGGGDRSGGAGHGHCGGGAGGQDHHADDGGGDSGCGGGGCGGGCGE